MLFKNVIMNRIVIVFNYNKVHYRLKLFKY